VALVVCINNRHIRLPARLSSTLKIAAKRTTKRKRKQEINETTPERRFPRAAKSTENELAARWIEQAG
jgi:hypothetical protein